MAITAGSTSVALLLVFCGYLGGFDLIIGKSKSDEVCGDLTFQFKATYIELIFVVILSIYSIWVLIIMTQGLLRKGINLEVKHLFLKRQFSYFAIVILTQIPYYIMVLVQDFQLLANNYLDEIKNPSDRWMEVFWHTLGEYSIENTTTKLLYCSRGILIFLWLCICQVFRYHAKTQLKMWFY